MRRRPFDEMVGDYQAMPGRDLDSEIRWLVKMIPKLQRQKAAALRARRLQRRKAKP